MPRPKDPKTFLNELEGRVKPLERDLCRLYWELATTGEEKTARELAETEKTLKILFSNRGEFEQLRKWKAGGIDDPVTARQIEILLNDYLPNQLDEKTIADLVERQTEIEKIFNNFRARLDGKTLSNNDIKDILRNEKNNDHRRAAWEASKQIAAETAPKVRELAQKRNEAARGLGFRNHFEMAFRLQELEPETVWGMFKTLKEKTEGEFARRIGALHAALAPFFGLSSPEAVRPWHYSDPFAQELPAQVTFDLDPWFAKADILKIAREFYQGMDLDIADVLEHSDLYEREKKSQHAFCICMDRGRDVRVLANCRPNEYWASTMLHELGHAAYSKNIAPHLPYFLRDESHIFATEAIAMLMERMIHHPEWLILNEVMEPEEARSSAGKLREALSLSKLIIARWAMLVTHFEQALYENPDQDLDSLWWKMVESFQKIPRPDNRRHPDWAAKIHIASHPVYYQNYLLGELFAAQIAQTLEREALKKPLEEKSFCGVKAVGRILRERLFDKGCSEKWEATVFHLTGERLGTGGFIRQFA